MIDRWNENNEIKQCSSNNHKHSTNSDGNNNNYNYWNNNHCEIYLSLHIAQKNKVILCSAIARRSNGREKTVNKVCAW